MTRKASIERCFMNWDYSCSSFLCLKNKRACLGDRLFCSQANSEKLVRTPERSECFTVRALTQLLECTVTNLANTLARNTKQRTDLFECAFLTIIETVVEIKNLSLTFCQILFEHPIEELALRL